MELITENEQTADSKNDEIRLQKIMHLSDDANENHQANEQHHQNVNEYHMKHL